MLGFWIRSCKAKEFWLHAQRIADPMSLSTYSSTYLFLYIHIHIHMYAYVGVHLCIFLYIYREHTSMTPLGFKTGMGIMVLAKFPLAPLGDRVVDPERG